MKYIITENNILVLIVVAFIDVDWIDLWYFLLCILFIDYLYLSVLRHTSVSLINEWYPANLWFVLLSQRDELAITIFFLLGAPGRLSSISI